MLKRLAACVVLFLLAGPAHSAFAWMNGPTNGNDYGTHDWILDRAIAIAGERGSWVDTSTALRATDDPDSQHTPTPWHLFRNAGSGRGAADQVSKAYYEAYVAYRKGDRKTASRKLGVLSHYYSDILNPFHSKYEGHDYTLLHAQYERMVDSMHSGFDSTPQWAIAREPTAVTDIRKKTISAAYFSRGYFWDLKDSLASGGDLSDATVYGITGEMLNRACNDLADVICALPTGQGVARAPAKLVANVSKQCPAKGSKVSAYVNCSDKQGKPVEGAGVKFEWKFSKGTKTETVFCDSHGTARSSKEIGSSPLMRKVKVVAIQSSAGSSKSASTWFMATPKLGGGRRGISATANSPHPRQHAHETVSVVCKDKAGKRVKGLPVTFTWHYRNRTVHSHRVTNSKGIARCTQDIGHAQVGFRVKVSAHVHSGGVGRTSLAYFTPR